MSYGFIKAVPQSLSHDRDYATNELDKTGSTDLRNKPKKPDRPYPQFTPTTEELIMEAQNQQDALRNLIENIYQQDLKAFLVDLAEIAETDNQTLIENLWECARLCPIVPDCAQ